MRYLHKCKKCVYILGRRTFKGFFCLIMIDKPNFYAVLLAPVRYSSEITDFAKILFSEITALSNKNGFCTAKNSYFCEVFDKKPRTVSRAISQLQNAGFLTVEITKDKKGTFRNMYPNVAPDSQKRPAPKPKKTSPGTTKKAIQKNNTSNNNNTSINNKKAHKKNNFETSCFDGLTAEEKQIKKVAAKKESTPPAASACLQPFEMSIQGLRNNAAKQTGPDGLPLGWSAEIKKNFLYYCETMSFKKGGRWGSVRQIAELFDTINKYFIKYTAEEINDCLKYAANNSNTNFNPEFTRNRRNKDKQKGGAATAQNYDLVKEQLNNPDFLNL